MSSARRAPHRSWHVCSRLSTSEFDSCSATHMATVRLRHRPPLTADRAVPDSLRNADQVHAYARVNPWSLPACSPSQSCSTWSADRRNDLAQPATSHHRSLSLSKRRGEARLRRRLVTPSSVDVVEQLTHRTRNVRATATVESQPQPRNKAQKRPTPFTTLALVKHRKRHAAEANEGGNTSRASEGGNATRSRHWSNAVPNERSISVDGLVERL